MVEEIKKERKNKLIDCFGRNIDYIRLSVTDRCDLKCVYCHPPHKINYLDRSEICSYGELLQVVRVASKLGIEKVRLTGGELFLRKNIIEFIHSLQGIDDVKEIALTTNGTSLLPHLKRLKEIGLRRVNISLDTLSEDLYHRITGSHRFFAVLEGIQRALEEGFKIKINMVVLRGINETEITEFIQYFLKNSVEIRFIEFMPLCGPGWREDYFFPYEKIKEVIKKKFDIHLLPSSGVAQEFALRDGNGLDGKIGIIAPVTRSFCSSCSRLRLSASGELRPCLFSKTKVELLPLLRNNLALRKKEKMIREAFKEAVKMKPSSMSKDRTVNDVYIRSLGG
jgi:cyclic pyranopterin phosphate synthase